MNINAFQEIVLDCSIFVSIKITLAFSFSTKTATVSNREVSSGEVHTHFNM